MTYDAVAQHSSSALANGERVRIHRRKFGNIPASICCECSIRSVEPIPGTNGFKVEFRDPKSLSIEKFKRLQAGYYFAAPDHEEGPE